jgi:hypothetical protein
MKKPILNFAFAALSLFGLLNMCSTRISAQASIIYYQNFDAAYALPTGWSTSNSSWAIDSGNSSGTYTGASGLNNVVIQNVSSPLGYDTLVSTTISTMGYANITAIWGARNTKHFADSGSTISFYWSNDGGATWNNVPYTENANNSDWALDNAGVPIALPSGAANQPSLQFAWIAHIFFDSSGTYRIDDFTVGGVSTAGIQSINADMVNVYCSNSSVINVVSLNPLNQNLNVEVLDLTGNVVKRAVMNAQSMSINGSDLSSGIYLVRVGNETESSVSKVFIR